MKLPKTHELEKGLRTILKKEKVSFGNVTVEIISTDGKTCVLEYVVRVHDDNYNQARSALLKHFPNMTIEDEFKFVRGVLFLKLN